MSVLTCVCLYDLFVKFHNSANQIVFYRNGSNSIAFVHMHIVATVNKTSKWKQKISFCCCCILMVTLTPSKRSVRNNALRFSLFKYENVISNALNNIISLLFSSFLQRQQLATIPHLTSVNWMKTLFRYGKIQNYISMHCRCIIFFSCDNIGLCGRYVYWIELNETW